VRSGRASSTVKKERAALNTFLRWLVEFEHISALQARHALAVKLPRAQQAGREAPKALSAGQYDDLLRAAKAAIADDPLAGARDLAIVLVLGDGGLRCDELAGLQRLDFVAARKGAKLRALEVRSGLVAAIVNWNTHHMNEIVERERAAGRLLADVDLARLSPAIHAHINLNGRYHIHPDLPPRRLVAKRDGLATYK
jgi:site-specific recombinase XerC